MDNRKQLTVNIDPEVVEAVASYARANGLSKSAVVEAFLKHFMARSEIFRNGGTNG